MVESSKKALVENEKVFREVNEQIKRIDIKDIESGEFETKKINFVCECSDEQCFERVYLTLPEYQIIRQNSNRFILVEGHEEPSVEDNETHLEGYTVVKKKKALT